VARRVNAFVLECADAAGGVEAKSLQARPRLADPAGRLVVGRAWGQAIIVLMSWLELSNTCRFSRGVLSRVSGRIQIGEFLNMSDPSLF